MSTLAPGARVGLVGYGRWGARWAKILAEERVLGWIVDVDHRQRTAARNDHPGVPVYEQLDLAGFELADTVGTIVATPPDTHFAVARELLEERQPVLLEKPMTTSVEHANALVTLARRRATRLMVDHTFAYAPAVVAAINWVRDRVGPVRYVRWAWRNVTTRSDEGALWNLGPHPLAVSAEFARGRGTYVESVSSVPVTTQRRGVADSFDACLRMADGSVEMVHLSNFGPEKVREFAVTGEAGSIVCRPNQREVLWMPRTGKYEMWTDVAREERQPLTLVLRRFLDRRPLGDEHGEVAANVVATMEAMEAAAYPLGQVGAGETER